MERERSIMIARKKVNTNIRKKIRKSIHLIKYIINVPGVRKRSKTMSNISKSMVEILKRFTRKSQCESACLPIMQKTHALPAM